MAKKDALLANSVLQFVQLKQSQLSLKKEKTVQEELQSLKLMHSSVFIVVSVKKRVPLTPLLKLISLHTT